ncbi:MAG TPA: glycosyltransferase [Saprospiraceae bacterium]|nr:glycosyltransferase [Saprospiraceae bacterium]
MKFDQIILCTDAPERQGLAYYYYLAFRDIIGVDKVSIIDEEKRKYDASLISRIYRRFQLKMNVLSRKKYLRLLNGILPSKRYIVILFNNANLKYKEIKSLSDSENIYLANYLSDGLFGMNSQKQTEVIESLHLYELVTTFATDLLPVLYQMGAKKVARIPFAYCKYTHLESTASLTFMPEKKLYYFGTWTPTIELWLSYLLEFDLVIEGNGWGNAKNKIIRKIGTKKNPGTDQNMAILARKAGLVINFTRAQHGCFHTMKTFELTASGACVLSNYSREQEEFFKNGKSIIYFNTPKEMVEQVNYYFNNPIESNSIRDEAIKAALPNSYHVRAKQFLDILES